MKSGSTLAKKTRKSKTNIRPQAAIAFSVPPRLSTVPVIVKNLSTQAVPVEPQGETKIAGSVAITNIPNVPVATTPGLYANMIRLLGRAWADDGSAAADGSSVDQRGNPFTVPAGKRLIVESVSGSVKIPCGQTAFYVSFWTGHPRFSQYLAPQLSAAGVNNADFYTIEERRVCAYADAGEQVRVEFARTGSTGLAEVSLTFNGYLMDLS